MADFKARIAALARGRDPRQNGDYVAPHVDAATIMADLGISTQTTTATEGNKTE